MAVSANLTSNTNLLADTLMYHFVSGSFPPSAFAMAPNHTILRTFLNDSTFVMLEANHSQVLAASNEGGMITLLNQPVSRVALWMMGHTLMLCRRM